MGSRTSVNGLPGVRIQFNGDYRHEGKTVAMQGIGYLLVDNSNCLFIIGCDYGSNAEASIPKLEKALLTVQRPGFSMSTWAWNEPSRSRGKGPGSYGGGSRPDTLAGGSGSLAGRSSSGPGPSGSKVPGGPSYPGGSGPHGPGASVASGGRIGPGPRWGPGRPSAGMGPVGGSGMHVPGGRPSPGALPRSGMPGGEAASAAAARQAQARAEQARRASELASTAADADDPEYFTANGELLDIGNDAQKISAIQRLAQTDPHDVSDAELRKQLARKLRDVAEDKTVNLAARRAAIPVLVQWTGSYSVPILTGLLVDHERFIQIDALEQLTNLKDPRAIEPVTRLFVENALLRDKAAECLRVFGAAAEDKVLELSRPADVHITRATVQLLGDIGTDKSRRPLGVLRKLPFYRLVQKDVNLALEKIREREDESEK